MLDIEIYGSERVSEPPSDAQVQRLCMLALASVGLESAHIAIEFVSASRIAQLNAQYRGKHGPTDVLSFPIDGVDGSVASDPNGPPRELGDIVICPAHTADLQEAILHGALHLLGMDHERDHGEMLAVQAELLRWTRL